jgi:hypothetical protein
MPFIAALAHREATTFTKEDMNAFFEEAERTRCADFEFEKAEIGEILREAKRNISAMRTLPDEAAERLRTKCIPRRAFAPVLPTHADVDDLGQKPLTVTVRVSAARAVSQSPPFVAVHPSLSAVVQPPPADDPRASSVNPLNRMDSLRHVPMRPGTMTRQGSVSPLRSVSGLTGDSISPSRPRPTTASAYRAAKQQRGADGATTWVGGYSAGGTWVL